MTGNRPVAPAGANDRDDGSWTDDALPDLLSFRVAGFRLSFRYRCGLALVAFVMLILPLCYGLLTAALASAVGLYAVFFLDPIVASGRLLAILTAYVGPVFAGAMGVLFMVKPILAPRPDQPDPKELTPEQQPLLFAYVERLCGALGSPVPKRIVAEMVPNAAASFGTGLVSLARGDLTLHVGLPYAAGLRLDEWTGVLAHELGHFRQRSAMRFYGIIGRVNSWFYRVVFERDGWDEWLSERTLEGGGWWPFFASLAAGMVWVTRKILSLLMHVGAAASAFLSRQMEFNADAYETAITGSESVGERTQNKILLQVAWDEVLYYLSAMWTERERVDDVVQLFLLEAERLTHEPPAWEAIETMSSSRDQNWWDTHPTWAARSSAVQSLDLAPKLICDDPASVLFRDWKELCRELSDRMYVESEDGPVTVVSAAEAMDRRIALYRSNQRIASYFLELPIWMAGIYPGSSAEPLTADTARIRLSTLRTSIEDIAEGCAELLDRLEALRHLNQWAGLYSRCAEVGEQMLDCFWREVDSEFYTGLREREVHAANLGGLVREELSQVRESLSPMVDAFVERIRVGSAVAADTTAFEPDSQEAKLLDLAPRIHAALAELDANRMSLRKLHQESFELQFIESNRSGEGGRRGSAEAAVIGDLRATIRGQMHQLREAMRGSEYPYEHDEEAVTIGDFLFDKIPGLGGDMPGSAGQGLEKSAQLYVQALCDLVTLASEGEEALGLAPLNPPSPHSDMET